ncbi:MAG: hypothetical protein ACK5CY_04330, partial [Bacteroidia bacterium]
MKNVALPVSFNLAAINVNRHLARWLLVLLFGIFLFSIKGFSQTAAQNFGSTTGAFSTANGTSTTLIPNPTGSGST